MRTSTPLLRRLLPFAACLAAVSATAANYKLVNGFESGDFSGLPIVNFENGCVGTVQSSVAFSGDYAFQPMVNYDSSLNGGYHCEVGRYLIRPGLEHWWGFAIQIPTTWIDDANNCVLMQAHQLPDAGEPDRAPPLVLRLEGSTLILESRWDPNLISAPAAYGLGGTVQNVTLWTGPVVKGAWLRFVFHVRWDYNANGNGLVEAWMNDAPIAYRAGPNCFNDVDKSGTLRFGLYKRNYATNNRSAWVTAYYDAIRVTDQIGSYADVSPYALYRNCGEALAVGDWQADAGFSGDTSTNVNGSLSFDTSAVLRPAPQRVYQSQRLKNTTYTLGGLTPGMAYSLDLHFAEFYQTAAGGRVFNVFVNEQNVLPSFDVFAAAGGQRKVHVVPFTATANASGVITVRLANIVNNAQICAIHLFN